MEQIRLALIKWNVAPLMLVVFFCVCAYLTLNKILEPDFACEKSEWYMLILSGIVTGAFGFLFQMYGSLQKNRG